MTFQEGVPQKLLAALLDSYAEVRAAVYLIFCGKVIFGCNRLCMLSASSWEVKFLYLQIPR
jgi:hypothetical protein